MPQTEEEHLIGLEEENESVENNKNERDRERAAAGDPDIEVSSKTQDLQNHDFLQLSVSFGGWGLVLTWLSGLKVLRINSNPPV